MLAKSLVAFIGVGVVSALFFGIYLDGAKKAGPVHVDGQSVTILLEKPSYRPGEQVRFLVLNSGTVGLETGPWSVTGLSGIGIYGPGAAAGYLEPGEEAEMEWNQANNLGEQVPDGIYKIVVKDSGASATVTVAR